MSKKKRRKKKKREKKVRSQKPLAQKPQPQKVEEKTAPGKKPKKKKLYLFASFLLLLVAATLVIFSFLIPRKKVIKDSSLNVLLVTLDTTRTDRLGCYGYQKAKTQNLDSIAANGVLFMNAYCQVPLTTPSHCSILTGTYPLYHQVRNNGNYSLSPDLTTLAEILKGRGFQTAAFVSSFTVDSRLGLDQGFDVYDDNFVEGQAFKSLNSERKAEKVFASFSRWLDQNQSGQFFCWVHFFDPHLPYDPPSPFREEFPDDPYDGEIAYMDHYTGKVVEKLREKKLLGRTLIILAGDHGEAFGEKEEVGHGIFLYEGTMRVPLLFYAENHLPRGLTLEPRARLIDILPSILDLLDIPAPKDIQGQSLLPYINGKKKDDLTSYIETYFPRENHGWSELTGLIDGDWKYIRAPREELYNLKIDPEEIHNAASQEPKVLQEKKKKLGEIIALSSSRIEAKKRAVTAEELERLRSLGYASYSKASSDKNLPDPKDRIEELRMFTRAETYEFQGNFQEAAKIYGQILSLRPDTPQSYVNLALVEAKMGRFEEAIRTLEQGIEKIPDSEILLSRLGHTFMVTGRLKKSLDTFDRVLKNNPRHFDALLASAWCLNLMDQKEDAQAYYRKALEVEPENKFTRTNYALSLAISGKIAQAIDIYNSLIREYPDDHTIYQDIGIAYGYAGDISRSIENLERAISLHPTPIAYINLAVAMRKVGKLEEACRYLKLYLENPKGESKESINRARAELQNLERILKR